MKDAHQRERIGNANKATVMHHLMPVRITISKEPTNSIINAEEAWRSGNLLHGWRECKLVRLRGRTEWKFLKKRNVLTFKEMNSMKSRQNRLIDKLTSFAVFSKSSAILK